MIAGGLGLLALGLGRGSAAAPVPEDSAHVRADVPASRPSGPEPQVRAVVVLVVLADPRPGAGEFPASIARAVAAEMRRVHQVEVRVVAARPLPRAAYYAPRRRYRADTLLTWLAGEIPAELPAGTRIVGLTTADISTTKDNFKDWGVFGLGELGGTAAMVSMHRLKKKARDAAHVATRVANTAVHELGHVLGLDHCEEPRCVMLDAHGGITNTDESSGVPGPRCLAELDRAAPLRPLSRLLARRDAPAQ